MAGLARRRRLLTLASGALIVLALLVRWVAGPGGVSSALMVAAAVVAGSDIAVRAWHALRSRHVAIELLVTLAAGGALIIGEYWEAAAVTFLFMLGAWLEARTMRHTRSALRALLDSAPHTAVLIREGEPVEVPAYEVSPGETVLVRPGQRVPVDGEVISGTAAVNESMITGEPIAALKEEGSPVYAGTVAESGLLRVRAVSVGSDTTLARIVRRVESAQEERAPTQRMIERFASVYTPLIIVMAAAAYVITNDLRLALTLLVVACPGALVISTPVSVIAGIGRAARSGILIKGGQHLEGIGRLDAIAFDKTGTLTEGRPRLVEVLLPTRGPAATAATADAPASLTRWVEAQREVVRWAAIAESGSNHPLGRPIVEAAKQAVETGDDPSLPVADELEEFAGLGVRARHHGREIVVGNRRLLERLGVTIGAVDLAGLSELRGRGHTPVLVALDGELQGILGLVDVVRTSAAPTLQRLKELGLDRQVLLTGDDRVTAAAVAGQVGIAEVHAELLPEQKLEEIRRIRAEGRRVGMVGDGINDAPALATADVSIAMGAAGSDIAIETADIALLADDLGKIPRAIEISRATLANMRQNLVIALVTVVGLLTGVLLGGVHMAGGMLIHQLSVLLVVLNGMRLLGLGSRSPGRETARRASPERLQGEPA